MEPLLDIRGLSVEVDGASVLHDVDLAVMPGEVVGLVGESGSGKSTIARAVAAALPPGAAVRSGRVSLAGTDLLALPARRRDAFFASHAGFVPQDPYEAFCPVRTVGSQFDEAMGAHGRAGRRAAGGRAAGLLASLGVSDARRVLAGYAFELSGGMCQRAALALAMCREPGLLVADEPASALDVVNQAQLIGELSALNARSGTALLVISHNMGVIFRLARRVYVLREGRVVEQGDVAQVRRAPRDPYTRGLIDAIPCLDAV